VNDCSTELLLIISLIQHINTGCDQLQSGENRILAIGSYKKNQLLLLSTSGDVWLLDRHQALHFDHNGHIRLLVDQPPTHHHSIDVDSRQYFVANYKHMGQLLVVVRTFGALSYLSKYNVTDLESWIQLGGEIYLGQQVLFGVSQLARGLDTLMDNSTDPDEKQVYVRSLFHFNRHEMSNLAAFCTYGDGTKFGMK